MNLRDELDRDRRAVLREYSASLMSNAKWEAVLSVLRDGRLGVRQIVVKFVDVVEPKSMRLPWASAAGFVDSLEFGPFSLIGIEWIEIPATAFFPRYNNVPAERYSQNIEKICSALDSLGKSLSLETTITGMRIIGHIR